MRYVQATKPEKHNGRVFFEHEIHITVGTGFSHHYTVRKLRDSVEQFISETIGEKHADFRVGIRQEWVRPDNSIVRSHVPAYWIVARFVDKNNAMRFKLAYEQQ